MPRQKMPREYFLKRIKEFYTKNNRAPRSDEFNGKFTKKVGEHFGSWAAAVKIATGTTLNYARLTDDELLQPIRETYEQSKRIPSPKSFPTMSPIAKRFGSYVNAVKAAIGIDIEQRILAAIETMTGPRVESASLAEITQQLHKEQLCLTADQVRGMIVHLSRRGDVLVSRGDRVRLFSLTNAGRKFLTSSVHPSTRPDKRTSGLAQDDGAGKKYRGGKHGNRIL